MQTNFYYLKQLSARLNQIISGKYLTECFSQDKDELILAFTDNHENNNSIFYIKALLSPTFACLSFPKAFNRANQNSVNIFEKLIGSKVSFVKQHTNERAFTIYFNNNFLFTFKLFGNKSNIILFKNESVVELFQNNIKNDKTLKYNTLDRVIDQSFEAFQIGNGSVKSLFPTINNKIIEKINLEIGNKDFNLDQKWETVQQTINQLNSSEYFIVNEKGVPALSMLKEQQYISKYNDAIEVANEFYASYTRFDVFDKEKANELALIDKQIKKLNYGKSMLEIKYENLINGVKNDELANILMANLHAINNEMTAVELFDFYRNIPVIIKLKKGISPQKNAENYYRKAKNEKTEIDFITDSIQNKQAQIEKLIAKIEAVNMIQELKILRAFLKVESKIANKTKFVEDFPFKIVIIDGWEIWIGRNANNNDLLTQKYAKKDDMWFHARDVAGSHVIIRYQSGKTFPKNVIERAAQLAAFNSKRKTDTLCPVIMTPKKFVRKTKNMAAGKVIVEKEEVLLVEPKS
jgi:predicted ribosome quality control (RQC) complex YloA/Tae2 family protein